jgi:hypothetical protein
VRRSCRIAALIAVVQCVPALSSVASAERRIAVAAAGSCPGRDAVIAALAQAMPDVIVAEPGAVDGAAAPVVVVNDHGASYHAAVGGITRTFFDAAADCEERARKVAVVVALALEPPLIAIPVPSPPPPLATPLLATPAPATPPSTPPAPGIGVRIETGGTAERGYGKSRNGWSPRPGSDATPRLTARLALERGDLGLVLGGGWGTWQRIDNVGILQRFPIDLAVRLRQRTGLIAGALELGPSVVVLRSRDAYMEYRNVQWEIDVRMALQLEVWSAKGYGAFAAVVGSYAPRPAPLIMPASLDERMPRAWVGGSVGLAIQLR